MAQDNKLTQEENQTEDENSDVRGVKGGIAQTDEEFEDSETDTDMSEYEE